jgi:uncharacterized repeat protein (TIGR03803 family)
VRTSGGNFHGTTQGGGSFGGHRLRCYSRGDLTTLYNFCSQPNCSDGSGPLGLALGADGKLYGTTVGGGNNGSGMIFNITPSGTLTTLYSSCAQANCPDGQRPSSPLIQATDSNFYGVTALGG